MKRWSLVLQPYTFTVEHKKGRDNTNADALSLSDYTLHYVPKKEGGDVMDGREDSVNCAGREHEWRAEVILGSTRLVSTMHPRCQNSTGLVSTMPLRWQDWIIGGDVSKNRQMKECHKKDPDRLRRDYKKNALRERE